MELTHRTIRLKRVIGSYKIQKKKTLNLFLIFSEFSFLCILRSLKNGC